MLGRLPFLTWHSGKAFVRCLQPVLPLTPLTKQCLITRPCFSPSLREYRSCSQPLLASRNLRGVGVIYCGVWRPSVVSAAVMATYPFCADYDKRGMAKCKLCKEKCEKGTLRLGKVAANPFSSGDTMKLWYHTDCLFESFKRARATTKKIEDPEEDLENWADVEDEDRKKILGLVEELQDVLDKKAATTPKKQTPKKKADTAPPQPAISAKEVRPDPPTDRNHKDNSFREFRRLCAAIADEPSYLSKTQLVSDFLSRGSGKDGFKGDLRLWVKLLLPGVVKRVYNLQSKQLLKLYSQIFNTNLEEMMEDLEQGDVAETVCKFFEESRQLPPVKKSNLSLQDVDEALQELSGKTREEDQTITLRAIAKKSTANDLKMVVRLIKGDLRINAGAKHILDGVHSDAYEAFQTTRNIDSVLDKIISGNTESLKMSAELLTPVLPMLAEACKSVEYAFKKCPSGVMYAEVKYDGERVQLHKQGTNFKYFSRSLKPVMPHKVDHFKEYIPQAFPGASNLILDAEVLMICTKTGNPLPFGTLGIHKKAAFQDACPCLFVFDCLHYNGEDLMNKPIVERRGVLEKTMKEVENRVMFSEMVKIKRPEDLRDMIARVLKQGLEGLVLKDIQSIYEPGKRHWLKVKKDYLNDGAMADTADLVVLGAWYGTGKKGGMMSVFLMGCYDHRINKWCTVTKVHTGHDDAALERLQKELDMVKISQDLARVPQWLKVNRGLVPDFVAADPKRSPVWEITGAEFTKHQIHTADGISIRFPRVTRERDDKDWESATSLSQLKDLYQASKECLNLDGLTGGDDEDSGVGVGSAVSKTPSPSSSASPSPAKKNEEDKKVRKNKTERKEDSGKKRKREEGDDRGSTHDNKKKVSQSNAVQRTLFQNPSPSSSTSTKGMNTPLKAPTCNPLPDFLAGVLVVLPDDIKERALLRRYIMAYGGEVLPDYRADQATHVIASKQDSDTHKGAGVRVREAWAWDSVKLQRLMPAQLYQV